MNVRSVQPLLLPCLANYQRLLSQHGVIVITVMRIPSAMVGTSRMMIHPVKRKRRGRTDDTCEIDQTRMRGGWRKQTTGGKHGDICEANDVSVIVSSRVCTMNG